MGGPSNYFGGSRMRGSAVSPSRSGFSFSRPGYATDMRYRGPSTYAPQADVRVLPKPGFAPLQAWPLPTPYPPVSPGVPPIISPISPQLPPTVPQVPMPQPGVPQPQQPFYPEDRLMEREF